MIYFTKASFISEMLEMLYILKSDVASPRLNNRQKNYKSTWTLLGYGKICFILSDFNTTYRVSQAKKNKESIKKEKYILEW